jgi:hypothetical protein
MDNPSNTENEGQKVENIFNRHSRNRDNSRGFSRHLRISPRTVGPDPNSKLDPYVNSFTKSKPNPDAFTVSNFRD